MPQFLFVCDFEKIPSWGKITVKAGSQNTPPPEKSPGDRIGY
jgi:hypothetical protein